ncbi:hypothetical protein Va1_026 [Vibrio phage Va1]|nr:hypothetical protein Va1_026 [Vibrio phage Va1]
MFTEEEIKEIKNFISSSSLESCIYIGTDSQRKRKGKTRYATVVIVHYDGNKGSKVFGTIDVEKDVKEKLSRPFNRMMMETLKSCEAYELFAEAIGTRHCEVHLDVSQDKKCGSNVALQAAVGYVQGTIGLEPVTKPAGASFAASCCADKFVRS